MAGGRVIRLLALAVCVYHVVCQGNSTCKFEPKDWEATSERVLELLKVDEIKMIRYNVKFTGYPADVLVAGSELFRPHQWLRTANRKGVNLLMFDDNFEVFSLSVLSIGIHNMELELVDNPRGCLTGLSASQRMRTMRSLLQTDFQNTTKPADERGQFENICNGRVSVVSRSVLGSDERKASFSYTCCKFGDVGIGACADIESDRWIVILNYTLAVAIVVFILYCPKLLSVIIDSNDTGETTEYTVTLPDNCQFQLGKTDGKCHVNAEGIKIPLDDLPSVSRIKSALDDDATCKLATMTISVPAESLFPQNARPVSIFRTFYDGIFGCQIATFSAFNPCCISPVCTKWCNRCTCTWYSIFIVIGKLLLVLTFSLPFIAEVIVYYMYISPKFEAEDAACERFNTTCLVNERDLDILGLRHMSKISLLIYVAIAVASGVIAEFVLVGFFNQTAVFSNLLIKSQKEYKIFPILKIFINTLLAPFKDYGLLGICVFPLYLPKLICYVLYTFLIVFPLMKIIVGLVYFTINSIYGQFKDKKPIWRIVLESAVCIIVYYAFLITMLILLAFCVTFYTEIFFYTLVGVIANASSALPLLAMLLPLGVYTRGILGSVGTVYKEFLKQITQVLLSRNEEENGKLGDQNLQTYRRNAFVVSTFTRKSPTEIPSSFVLDDKSDSGISYRGNMLLVFVETDEAEDAVLTENSSDAGGVRKRIIRNVCPSKSKFEKKLAKKYYENGKYYIYTPANLFYYMADLDIPGSPGPIRSTILAAFARLGLVIGFLAFVVVAVMGLGESYKITMSNQLMLTVVGSVIPLIFRYGLFNYRLGSVDWSNEEILLNIIKAIELYSEEWQIVDITLSMPGVIIPDDVAVVLENEKPSNPDLPIARGDNSGTEKVLTSGAIPEVKVETSPGEGEVLIPMNELTPSVT